MNDQSCCADKARLAAWIVGIGGTLLIVAALVWTMDRYTRPSPLGADRAQERRKNLAELRAAEADAVNNYGWQDQPRGIVRLKVERGIELTLKEWQNPAAARSNLLARVDKAAAPLPKAPEKPSAFE